MSVSHALKTFCLSTVSAAALAVLVQACGGGDIAVAQATPDPVVGVWESVVTQRDCASGTTLATFRGSQVFHSDGTLVDTNAGAPTSRGVGMGVWTRSGSNVVANFRFYRFNTDGTLAGSNVVTRTVTLAADGNSATATTTFKVLDPAGNTLQSACAADTSTRFKAG